MAKSVRASCELICRVDPDPDDEGFGFDKRVKDLRPSWSLDCEVLLVKLLERMPNSPHFVIIMCRFRSTSAA